MPQILHEDLNFHPYKMVMVQAMSGYITSETHVSGVHTILPLHDEKIGVWFGMSRGRIFFSDTLNYQQYCVNIVYPFIVQLKD